MYFHPLEKGDLLINSIKAFVHDTQFSVSKLLENHRYYMDSDLINRLNYLITHCCLTRYEGIKSEASEIRNSGFTWNSEADVLELCFEEIVRNQSLAIYISQVDVCKTLNLSLVESSRKPNIYTQNYSLVGVQYERSIKKRANKRAGTVSTTKC